MRITITILLLVHFWEILNSQEDVVGVPLFPKLYLARARAMHDVAVAKAKARAKSHLLLQANPEYTENAKQMDFNSYVSMDDFNNENFVSPYVSYYDIKHEGTGNIETGYIEKYPYEDVHFIHHKTDSTPDRMVYNKEVFQGKNFNNDQYNLKNEEKYRKNSVNSFPVNISTMENNEENILYYHNENETNVPNQFTMSKNLQNHFKNKPQEHTYTPLNRSDENTLTFNGNILDYTTKKIPLTNTEKDNVTSIPTVYSVNKIDNKTTLNDPEKNDFSRGNNSELSDDLTSKNNRVGVYSENYNNENDKSKSLNLNSHNHEPLHFDLGKLLLTNSYFESNQTLNNLTEMENKTNEHIHFQNVTDVNSKDVELLDSNLSLVNEDMKSIDDIFVNIIGDQDDTLSEENSVSPNANTYSSRQKFINDTSDDLQQHEDINNDKLHQLETIVGTEGTNSTILPTLGDPDITTEESNIQINLKVTPFHSEKPKLMTLKENYSNCGYSPIRTISTYNQVNISTLNDTNATGEEIQQKLRILNEDGSKNQKDNVKNAVDVNVSKIFQNPANNDQENKLQFPENLEPFQEINRKQDDMERTTNYEVYSNNHNFHNRQRDEQLYLWSLNNIQNNKEFLQSSHAETSLKNPLAYRTVHKFEEQPIGIRPKSMITVMDPSKRPLFENHKEESKEYRHTFDKLMQYIADIHGNKEINSASNAHLYKKKFKPTNPTFRNSKRKDQIQRNNLEFSGIWEDQLYPERVSSYLLHFPQNERYYGQRYRREIRRRKDKKLNKIGTSNKRLPLINLLTDPSAKLDVPETMKNIGSVTRNSLENENAPLYHLKNMLASAKNAVLSAMIIPSQNVLIPTRYEIIDKNTPRNDMSNTRLTNFEDVLKESYLGNNNKVFQKIGSIMRHSIHSSQQALQDVSDVAHNARKAFSSTHRAIPKLLLPYIKAPMLKKEKKVNKLSLITPHVTNIIKEKESHSIDDDHIKVGMVMDALGLSHPNQEEMGSTKFIFHPKKIQPKLISRFGDTTQNEIPGYYIIDNRLQENKLNSDEIHEVIEILHKVKDASGSKSLKDFLLSLKTHFENDNVNVTQFLNQTNETVGNLPLAGDLLKPFLGMLPVTAGDAINQDVQRKTPKRRHILPKNNYRELENAAFANFIAGYEIVSSINPEMYRFYTHEPFKVNHSADVNLKEIQHDIENSNMIIPIEDLYNTIKNSLEETKAAVDVHKDPLILHVEKAKSEEV